MNGLTGDASLVEGQPLIIPVGVVRNTNNASTFQPYDPLEVLGNTSPHRAQTAEKQGSEMRRTGAAPLG